MIYDRDSQLAAACLMGSFDGVEVPSWLTERIAAGLGSVCLFAQNVGDDDRVAAMTSALHAARRGVVIAIDEEGGDVTRLDAADGSDTPCPAAFGAVDDLRLTRLAYRSLGLRLADLGIDLTLAPCADINSNPHNPIIGVRSFGATADIATQHTAACIEGFADGGVGTCVKHFPGHGDTVADTHLGGARVDASLTEMEGRELVPFRAAIESGVDAVLTAHIVAACVDDRPVSLSRSWTEYLRNELGFDGVVITDALDMGAVAGDRGTQGVADAAVEALAAGADLLCLGSNFDAEQIDLVVATVVAALRDGRLDRAALEQSAVRISKLGRSRGAARRSIEMAPAAEVARRAVVVDGTVPAGIRTVVECRPKPSMASFNVTWGLARHLSGRGWATHTIVDADGADDLVVGSDGVVIVVRDLDVHAWQRDVIARFSSTPRVVVELGWPSAERPDADAYIISHGAARVTTRAIAEVLSAGKV
jgi:beta-N-acetylhexosaminidase